MFLHIFFHFRYLHPQPSFLPIPVLLCNLSFQSMSQATKKRVAQRMRRSQTQNYFHTIGKHVQFKRRFGRFHGESFLTHRSVSHHIKAKGVERRGISSFHQVVIVRSVRIRINLFARFRKNLLSFDGDRCAICVDVGHSAPRQIQKHKDERNPNHVPPFGHSAYSRGMKIMFLVCPYGHHVDAGSGRRVLPWKATAGLWNMLPRH